MITLSKKRWLVFLSALLFSAQAQAQEKRPLIELLPHLASFVGPITKAPATPLPRTEPKLELVDRTFMAFAMDWSSSIVAIQHLGYEMKYGYQYPRLTSNLPYAYDAIRGLIPIVLHPESGIRAGAHLLNLLQDPYRQWVIAGLRSAEFLPLDPKQFEGVLPPALKPYSESILSYRDGHRINVNLSILNAWQSRSKNSVDGIENWIVLEALKLWLNDADSFSLFYARYLDTLRDRDFSAFQAKDVQGNRLLSFLTFTEKLQQQVQKSTGTAWLASASIYRQVKSKEGYEIQFIGPTQVEALGHPWKSSFLTQYVRSEVDSINQPQAIEKTHALLWCDELESAFKTKKNVSIRFRPQVGAVHQIGTTQRYLGLRPWALTQESIELNSENCEVKFNAAIEAAKKRLIEEFFK